MKLKKLKENQTLLPLWRTSKEVASRSRMDHMRLDPFKNLKTVYVLISCHKNQPKDIDSGTHTKTLECIASLLLLQTSLAPNPPNLNPQQETSQTAPTAPSTLITGSSSVTQVKVQTLASHFTRLFAKYDRKWFIIIIIVVIPPPHASIASACNRALCTSALFVKYFLHWIIKTVKYSSIVHTCSNIHMIVQWYVDLHVLVLINDRYAKVTSITEIVMKVKVQGHGEAGWLVKVTEVTED